MDGTEDTKLNPGGVGNNGGRGGIPLMGSSDIGGIA